MDLGGAMASGVAAIAGAPDERSVLASLVDAARGLGWSGVFARLQPAGDGAEPVLVGAWPETVPSTEVGRLGRAVLLIDGPGASGSSPERATVRAEVGLARHRAVGTIWCSGWQAGASADALEGSVAVLGSLCDVAALGVDRIRSRAEAGLAREESWESEERHRALSLMRSDVAIAGDLLADGTLSLRWVGGSLHEISGYTADELADPSVLRDVVHPDSRDEARAMFEAVLAGDRSSGELRVRTRDGGTRWIEAWCAPDLSRCDGLRGIIGAARDVTERRHAREQLRSSDSQHRAVFEHARAAIIIFDRDERILKVNSSACRMYGYSEEEFVGASLDLIQPDSRRGMDRTAEILSLGDSDNVVIEHRRRDGSHIFVDVVANEVDFNGAPAVLSLNRDVTASQTIKGTLDAIVRATDSRTGSEFFHALTRNISMALGARWVGIGQLDGERVRLVSVCRDGRPARNAEYDLAGTPCEGIVDDRRVRFYARGVAEEFPKDKSLVKLGLNSYTAIPLIGSDERVLGLMIAANTRPLDDAVDPIMVLQLCAGRTAAELERLVVDAAREEAEARFSQIAENMSEAFWLADRATGRMLYLSHAYQTIWGRPVAEVIGTSGMWRETVHREDLERLDHAIRHAPESNGYDIEYRIRRPDGEVRWVHERAFPVRGRAGKILRLAGFSEDVTDRRESEEHRTMMVRELNHRVKNNLNAVIGLAEQTLRDEGTIEGFRESFFRRVRALARSHTMIAESGWRDVSLPLLVHDTLQAFLMGRSDRLIVEGPDVSIPGRVSASVAMALHELATNAVKHGAFSSEEGAVRLNWTPLPDRADPDGPGLRLRWVELGGPEVRPPARRGFGTSIIERAVASSDGSSVLEFDPAGLRCEMLLPVVDRSSSVERSGLDGA